MEISLVSKIALVLKDRVDLLVNKNTIWLLKLYVDYRTKCHD